MKVRLKRPYDFVHLITIVCFNSMKVRLKPHYFVSGTITHYGFNSMKVRLKHTTPTANALILLFQFHEGPIKTLRPNTLRVGVRSFNSMKVRLKRVICSTFVTVVMRFNSMKVRLKHSRYKVVRF